MDEELKARFIAAAETIKGFCDTQECKSCPFYDAFLCDFEPDPEKWNIENMKEHLNDEQNAVE